MDVSTITPTRQAPRVHPAAWVGAALLLVALGAGGAVGFMKWQGPANAEKVAVTGTEKSVPSAPADGPDGAGAHRGVQPPPVPSAAVKPACTNCGVVEAVTPVQRKGEGTGVGAVVGGVVGGVVGNQMGGGRGRDAMTVIGAVGGGVAGHEVEKRARATTVYQVKVRMADGSTRTVTQASPLTVGQAVQVEGTQVTARRSSS